VHGTRRARLPVALRSRLIVQPNEKLKAPRWFLAFLLIVIAAHAIDAIGTLASMPLYQTLALPFSPVVKATIATIWTILLIVLFVGLLRKHRLAFAVAAPLLTVDAVAGLLWEIAFVQADYGRGRLGFQALLTVIILAPMWWLAVRRRWLARNEPTLTAG
jgi:hypothetical protein